MSDPIELAPDYYLTNFVKLTNHALEWYSDMLTSDELSWISHFEQLNKHAQCLLVRLLSRKGDWFRSDKLHYAEIGDVIPHLYTLESTGFIVVNGDICSSTLADKVLTKPEIISLFSINEKSLRKEQLIARVPVEKFTHFEQLAFTLIKLQQPTVINVLLALFFANTHQDLSQFVLDDLGLHQFEHYQLSKERRFFASRAELNQLLQLSELQSHYLDSDRKDADSLCDMLIKLSCPLEHPYLERKRQHLINDMARDLERLGRYTEALDWFNKTSLPPSHERQARIYDKLDQTDAMRDVVTKIIQSPYDIAELEVANKLADRIKRKLGQRVPRAARAKVEEYQVTLDLSQQRVELAVKEHFEQLGYQVFYSENLLLNGLFGLAFWDVLFAPVEGAFINRYQYRPLDLYHSDFASKRQVLIDQVFDNISISGLSGLTHTYQAKFGIANPFVHWSGFSLELLQSCIKHIPHQLVISLFKVMLTDLKLYRSGMPDLIAFKGGEFEWIEVKGPGDKLQDNQWRWIAHFLQLEVPFKVCYVQALPKS